jgi:hypothetical protein
VNRSALAAFSAPKTALRVTLRKNSVIDRSVEEESAPDWRSRAPGLE